MEKNEEEKKRGKDYLNASKQKVKNFGSWWYKVPILIYTTRPRIIFEGRKKRKEKNIKKEKIKEEKRKTFILIKKIKRKIRRL